MTAALAIQDAAMLRDPPPNEKMISYLSEPTPTAFRRCDDPMRLIVGPVGSGKSSLCCVEILNRAVDTPAGPDGVRRSRWAVVRNTYRELEDTTIKTFSEWVKEGTFGRWHESAHTFEIDFETEGGRIIKGEVLFRALDRPDDVKKLLSLELTGCYFNEWKEIPKPITDLMKTRVGRYPRKEDVPRCWVGVFGDTNPPDTDHYLYKEFEEPDPDTHKMRPGYKVFKQPGGIVADKVEINPHAENLNNLDACFDPEPQDLTFPALALKLPITDKQVRREYQRAQHAAIAAGHHEDLCRCYYVRLCTGADADFVNVMARGNYGFVKQGKPIYPEWQDDKHVAKAPIALLRTIKKLIIGNDYGLTPAAVWVQQDPSDGQYQVIRELVSEHLGAIRFAEEMLHIGKTEFRDIEEFEGWGDPAGNAGLPDNEDETVIKMVNAVGVPMRGTPTNDFTIRREAVAGCLRKLTMRGRPSLVISPSCTWLRKGMAGGYAFRRLQIAGDARFENKPNKNMYSHVCEALQYALVGAGEDRAALDGGQPKRVRVAFTTKMAGGSTNGPRHDEEDEAPMPFRFRVKKA